MFTQRVNEVLNVCFYTKKRGGGGDLFFVMVMEWNRVNLNTKELFACTCAF